MFAFWVCFRDPDVKGLKWHFMGPLDGSFSLGFVQHFEGSGMDQGFLALRA